MIKSDKFSSILHSFSSLLHPVTIKAPVGSFLLFDNTKNFLRAAVLKRRSGVCRKLRLEQQNISYIPLENSLVVVAPPYVVIHRADCGIHAFNRAREEIRSQHEAEHELLFAPLNFIWANPIDDERFEQLVLELIKVESGVRRARRTGTSRDADQGRDLIIEWETIPLGSESNVTEGGIITRRVVGQCKASSGSIGKGDVRDIRDTVEHHCGTGYFLATSSHLTNDLVTHLDMLKERGNVWTEWWTRSEIETRLRKNPKILERFSSIVRFEN